MNYPKSIIQGSFTCCYLCGSYGRLEIHHIFGGSNRKNSTQFGLTVALCPCCHRGDDTGVHGKNKANDLLLKRIGQREFEKTHSREEFMRLFHKNYL